MCISVIIPMDTKLFKFLVLLYNVLKLFSSTDTSQEPILDLDRCQGNPGSHKPDCFSVRTPYLSSGWANPYAVPCIIPKRKSIQVGSEKAADIFDRPSLTQSHGGYRTPNIKPLPVAIPTVSDSGHVPALPMPGYVLQI